MYEGHPNTFLPILWRGTLKRNVFISIRTPATLQAEMSPTLRQVLFIESYATFASKISPSTGFAAIYLLLEIHLILPGKWCSPNASPHPTPQLDFIQLNVLPCLKDQH